MSPAAVAGLFFSWEDVQRLADRYQRLELGMGFDDVMGDGTHNVDAERVIPGVLKGGGDQLERKPAAALFFGDFGVPQGHPTLIVGFEFEITGLAVLLDLEAAAGDFGWVGHAGVSTC